MTNPEPAPIRNPYIGAWIASLLLIVVFVLGLLIFPPRFDRVEGLGEPSSNVLFVGRLHPLLVHLPIGVLGFLVLIELLCLRPVWERKFGDTALLALWVGAAGSVFAVIAGIMLSREGGYSGGTFTLHQGLGIIGTAGVLLALVLRLVGMSTQNRALIDGYRALFFVFFGLMGVGAHFGGNLVHGPRYMTQYATPALAAKIKGMEEWMLSFVESPKKEEPQAPVEPPVLTDPVTVSPAKTETPATKTPEVPNPVKPAPEMAEKAPPQPTPPTPPADMPGVVVAGGEGKLVFQHLLLPILEEKCNNCHNEDKSKGDLRMDTYELMMKGGESGKNVVPGQPDQSLTINRIMLPLDDDEHMPPEGKDQLSPEELALLRWWIQEGASNTMTVNETRFPEETKPLVEKMLSQPTAMRAVPARPLQSGGQFGGSLKRMALLAVTMALTSVSAEEGKSEGSIDAATIKKIEATGASLLPIAAGSPGYRFTALNVAKEFNDASLAALEKVSAQIVSLDLARTQVTDAGLVVIAKMNQLKELRLDNTGITDKGLDHLKGLSSLEYLNLYGSKVTDAGIQKLAGLSNLKSLYLWQTGVTKAGVAQLRGKLTQTHINTGWSAEDDAKPVAVVAGTAAKPAAKPVSAPAGKTDAKPAAVAAIDAKFAASTVIYKDIVAPILADKCVSCHGEEKTKGKLKMDTLANLLKGGSEGEVNVVPGKADESLMIQRVLLPLNDDEHMPPEDKEQLSAEETAVLKWWINQGASETLTLDKAKRDNAIDGALAVVLKDKLPATVAAAKPAAAPKPEAKPAPTAAAKPKETPAPAPKKEAAAAPVKALDPALAAKAVVYRDVIAPILAEKCVSCHGEEKSKGKLRMHTFADTLRGGSEGEINVVAGKSGDSLLVQRILLPGNDDEHMPPEDEPQITKEELALLKWWIDGGASETETVAKAKKTPEIEGLLAVVFAKGLPKAPEVVKVVEKPKPKPLTEDEKKLVAEVSLKMQALNATLMPLAQDTELLRLSVINAADKFGDKELALLDPVAAQVVWLDLARSQVTDAGLETIAKMENLERLHLENTKVTDAGIAKLAGLSSLEYLNLYGTKVTDASLAPLAGVASLRKLFVWQTGVTRAAASALEGKVKGLSVNVGLSEAEIAKLTAPPPEPAKAEEKKPEPAKPAPAPAKKDDTKKPEAAKPATPPAKPAATPVKPKTDAATKPVEKPAAPKPKADAPPAAKPEAKPAPKAA